MKNFKIALAATALLSVATPFAARAQSTYDETQQLIAQIQTDARAIVLQSMALDDAQLAAFTPVFDAYQAETKKLAQRQVDLITAYSSNYDSMTDGAAKGLLNDWLKLQDDELSLTRKYAKKLDKVLPSTKVLRFVQIQNKLGTLLSLPAVQGVPLAK
ncbi:MAG: hypothetical protein OEY13_15220 [Gammaproteobacteria bacterium]|nr:hypothetical protein [Gammaproteobacteria bacterium]MDH4313059.1 hypothetical protein [Gammaproteobacteria bacterium]MDH5274410.1 hypothetical protein [Gammaproteobacteria bacterium]